MAITLANTIINICGTIAVRERTIINAARILLLCAIILVAPLVDEIQL
jgi:hypothetical protein